MAHALAHLAAAPQHRGNVARRGRFAHAFAAALLTKLYELTVQPPNLRQLQNEVFLWLRYSYLQKKKKKKKNKNKKCFFSRFYILCENFSKIGPIIKKIPKFQSDPLKVNLSQCHFGMRKMIVRMTDI